MGFKLGTERGLEVTGGEIRSKMQFHQEAGSDASVPGTPVIRKDLEPGVLGESNMDGSIYISNELEPGSFEERQVISIFQFTYFYISGMSHFMRYGLPFLHTIRFYHITNIYTTIHISFTHNTRF